MKFTFCRVYLLCPSPFKGKMERERVSDNGERKKKIRKCWKQAQQGRKNKKCEWESRRGAERVKLKGLDSSFPLNSLITSSHTGLGCHGNVYMTQYPAEAKTGMAHIMLNPQFTWHNPLQTNTLQSASESLGRQPDGLVGHLLMERRTTTLLMKELLQKQLCLP